MEGSLVAGLQISSAGLILTNFRLFRFSVEVVIFTLYYDGPKPGLIV